MAANPSTIAELLSRYDLADYAGAFIEQGWDNVPQLLGISEADFADLLADTKMKSGHARRLPAALFGPPPPAAAAPPPPEAAATPPPAPAAPPHAAPPPGAPPPAGPSPAATAQNLELQRKFHNKLLETNLVGELKHGTAIETYQLPAGDGSGGYEPVNVIASAKGYYCKVCPHPKSEDGTRSCGRSFSNAVSHLCNKEHWTCFRKRLGADCDDAAWLNFDQGKRVGHCALGNHE